MQYGASNLASQTLGFACFDTVIGTLAIAWGPAGITGSQLPERDAVAMRLRMQRRFPGVAELPPNDEAQDVVTGLQALMRGERVDLSGVRLDMRGVPDAQQRIYALARELQPGQTATYGELAQRLGDPALARLVGQAMGDNRFAPIMPCHRVVGAHGATGGFSSPGGVHTKLQMLAIEGAAPNGQPSLF